MGGVLSSGNGLGRGPAERRRGRDWWLRCLSGSLLAVNARRRHAYADTYCFSNTHFDSYSYSNSYTYGNPYTHSDSYGYGNADTYCYSQTHADAEICTDTKGPSNVGAETGQLARPKELVPWVARTRSRAGERILSDFATRDTRSIRSRRVADLQGSRSQCSLIRNQFFFTGKSAARWFVYPPGQSLTSLPAAARPGFFVLPEQRAP